MTQNLLLMLLGFLGGVVVGKLYSLPNRAYMNSRALAWVCSIVDNGRAIYGRGRTANMALADLQEKVKPKKSPTGQSKERRGIARIQFARR